MQSITKLVILGLSTVISVATATANESRSTRQVKQRQALAEIDKLLLNIGAVDSNYQFINYERANAFFDQLNTKVNAKLAQPQDYNDVMSKRNTYTTEDFTIAWTLVDDFPNEYKNKIKHYYQSPIANVMMLAEACDFLYISKFAKANDYQVIYKISDSNQNLIHQQNIDLQMCHDYADKHF